MLQLLRKVFDKKSIKSFGESKLNLSEAQRVLAIEEIRETDGFMVIMEDIEMSATNVRDVAELATHYGKLRIDSQLGVLGGGGLIASHALYDLRDKYEQEEVRKEDGEES